MMRFNVEELDYVLPTGSIKPRDEEGQMGIPRQTDRRTRITGSLGKCYLKGWK